MKTKLILLLAACAALLAQDHTGRAVAQTPAPASGLFVVTDAQRLAVSREEAAFFEAKAAMLEAKDRASALYGQLSQACEKSGGKFVITPQLACTAPVPVEDQAPQ